MTLDEAIKHCLEVADQNETKALRIGRQYGGTLLPRDAKECRKCAAEHRQLAEWLAELKEFRNSLGAVKLKDMKEAVGLLQELNTENDLLTSQLTEAKRLLKSAAKISNAFLPCDDDICAECVHNTYCLRECDRYFEWKYKGTDEALKLIGDEVNG